MKHSVSALAIAGLAVSIFPAAADDLRYFLISDGNRKNDFILELKDAAKIREALRIIHGKVTPVPHVSGIIKLSSASYNPPWSFHFEPSTITFPEISTEVCDAETIYVQAHLAEVGGHFLPGYRWCPWGQHVVREVARPR